MSSTIPVVALTILSCVNLILLLGVVRRLGRLTGPAPAVPQPHLPRPGDVVGNFVASTTDGDRVSVRDLSGWRLVGFFTVGCPPCEAFKPAFRAHANTFPGGRDRVLAVITGGKGDPGALADEMAEFAHVIVEAPTGPVSTAFGVTGFPVACLLKGDTITATGLDVESFRPPLPATAATR
jgi:hypothetical protein